TMATRPPRAHKKPNFLFMSILSMQKRSFRHKAVYRINSQTQLSIVRSEDFVGGTQGLLPQCQSLDLQEGSLQDLGLRTKLGDDLIVVKWDRPGAETQAPPKDLHEGCVRLAKQVSDESLTSITINVGFAQAHHF